MTNQVQQSGQDGREQGRQTNVSGEMTLCYILLQFSRMEEGPWKNLKLLGLYDFRGVEMTRVKAACLQVKLIWIDVIG